MSIREIPGKIKGFLNDDRLFPALLIAVVGCAAFGLGRLSALPADIPTSVQKAATQPSTSIEASEMRNATPKTGESTATTSVKGAYVASKNGGSYHLPWCGGASRIKEENKVWFQTKEEAVAAGLVPAKNCPGI